MPVIVRATVRVVLPVPLVEFLNVMVSEYEPAASVLATELTDAVTVVLAPAASVPEVAESVVQLCVLLAVQLMEVCPVFLSV